MSTSKKAAPKKAAKKTVPKKTRRKTPKVPPNRAYSLAVAPIASKHPYAGPGRKALFTSAEEIQIEVDAYFAWILGEKGTRKIKVQVYNKKKKDYEEKEADEEYWVRPPEPPTRTGLVLYLGFASHTAMIQYEKDTTDEFKTVIARARARVEQSYEFDLRNRDASNGARFALQNMRWDNTTGIQHKDKDGNSTDPPVGGGTLITQIFPNTTKPV